MDERENSLALRCRDGHLKWKCFRPLEAALGCKGRARSVKHVGWNWCCLCGHCLTRAFKKLKEIAAWRKVQTKSTVHENLMRDLRLSEPNDYSVLVRLVYPSFDELLKCVIPMQEKQSFPVSFFFFQPRYALWPLEILSKTRQFLFGHVYRSADSHGNRINVAQGCPQTVQYFRCCTVQQLNFFYWHSIVCIPSVVTLDGQQ